MPKNNLGDPVEAGRLGGLKSGETRRAKAEQKAEARALEAFAKESEDIAKELLDAALGRGKWEDHGAPVLDPKERVAVLKTCLEYGVGRPRPMAVPAESTPVDTERKGISFGVKSPEAPMPDSAAEAELELARTERRAAEE